MLSLIIPVYKNESNITELVKAVTQIQESLDSSFEVVYVVDGSPDKSYEILKSRLDNVSYPVQLVAHSRNFGSFAAIRTGLKYAKGEFFAVMAADLQEPPSLILRFAKVLAEGQCDVVIGVRNSRKDPLLSKISSKIFWTLYRTYVVPDIPEGGVDIFACNKIFRDHLLLLEESRSSLIALIFWLGFRKSFVSYDRAMRVDGKSAWTWKKKWEYMFDSIFSFTDYPIKVLIRFGVLGALLSIILTIVIISARLMGWIEVPGYAPIMLTVLFFGAMNILGIGTVGIYAWRAYENSKKRPLAVIATHITKYK